MLIANTAQTAILVIDDEPDNFDVIEAFLTEQDYQLHYANNAQAVLDNLANLQIDLILLDVMLPGMDGIELCRQIKNQPDWQMVPIMMVTALNTKADLAQCLQAGADDFIAKPVNSVELRARVQSLLRIKKQYDQLQNLLAVQTKSVNLLENTLTDLRQNLASTLSHELNTPLHGILGTLEMLKDYIEDMNVPAAQKMLGWASQSARRLENLTRRSRLYLDLELAALQPWTEQSPSTRLSSLSTQAELLALAELHQRRSDMAFALEESYLSIPENYLLTILYELVTNAIKFSATGMKILVQSQVIDHMLHISVQDLGRGMTSEQIEQIGAFMQFERQIYEQQGIGMGLKIVQKIIDLAGGQFTLQSIYKQGTTVTVALPIASSL